MLMKQRDILLYSALCLLTACTAETGEITGEPVPPQGQPLEVQAVIASVTATERTANADENYPAAIFNKVFTTSDVISISDGSTSYGYTYDGSSLWTPSTAGKYFTVVSVVGKTYTATYTNSNTASDGDIPQGQSVLANFRKCYYYKLVSPATVPATETNTVSFTGNNALHPIVARVTVKVTYPEERTPVSVTLKGKGIRTGSTTADEEIQCLYMNEPEKTTGFTKAGVQRWTAVVKPGNLAYTITIRRRSVPFHRRGRE